MNINNKVKDKNIHNKLITQTQLRLMHGSVYYDNIYRNKEYSLGKNFPTGEIDLYATRKDYVLLFEMKSNDSQHLQNKAENQLNRATQLFEGKRIFKFYVTPNDIKWIISKRNFK